MSRRTQRNARRGATLVLVAVSLVALLSCVALAIDLGIIMAARTQAMDVADAAAMAGCRALNGNAAANNNYAAVAPTAQQVVSDNSILATPLTAAQVSVNIGRYVYNTTDQQFEGQFPGPATDNWSLVQATVTMPLANLMAFSKMFNLAPGNLQVTSTAVHRPRDVAVVLDFSGSMRFQSLSGGLWTGANLYCNSPDATVPQFGHYSSVGAGTLWATSFTSPYDAANVTTTTSDGRPPIVLDFYQDANGTPAFSPASAGYSTAPGGDNFLMTNKNTSSSYAHTAAEVLNISSPSNSTLDATFESSGYTAYGMTSQYNGYTVGPNYWGKTFFIWPPNPVDDWRKLYFTYPGSTTPMDENSLMWDNQGNWQAPSSSTYAINYAAILNFIQNVGPNPFPSRLQSGRILYYSSIPTTIDTSSSPPSDLNQRFWKDYIDYVLGVVDLGGGNYQVISNGSTGYTGYGPDFKWGPTHVTPKKNLGKTNGKSPYMHYGDNPLRPISKFWFGPQSMIDFLGNFTVGYDVTYDGRYFWWPGTCHEAPMYACKLGIRAALSDIQNNHPNDWVSLMMFSTPQSSASDNIGNRFNRVRVGLGQNYPNMQDSLWYPPATVGNSGATVSPYDTNNVEVPRAFGGTCYAYPLMLAYNQFSGNTSLQSYSSGQPAGDAGGMGRKGAQKMIIFETDGAPNTTASAGFNNGGAYNSYYNIRYNYSNPGGSEYPTGVNGYADLSSPVTSQIYALCNQICAADSASTPGYSTGNKKVKIHCIGFGPVFATSSEASAATACLNQMQTIGNVTDGMPSYKIIYGNQSQIISNLQTAFQKIMTDGVQVTLIQ